MTGATSWIVRIAALMLELLLAVTVFQLALQVGSGLVSFLVAMLALTALAAVWAVFLSPKSPKRLSPLWRAVLSGGILAAVASLAAASGAPGLGTWLMVGVPILALCEYSLEAGGDSTPLAKPYY